MMLEEQVPTRIRIVILGGGFAGAYCAQALEKKLRGQNVDVLLLDRNNYFVFYPLLVEAGTGSLQPRHAVVSIRSFLKSTRFVMADVLSVDVRKKEVTYQVGAASSPVAVPFDHLVVALGSTTRLPRVAGLAEHGFALKSLNDAVSLRDRAIQMLELASATEDPELRRALLHFVVVGGNFTGVEVAAEYHIFLRQAARRYRNLDPRDCRVTLIEITERILPALDEDLSRYALQKMQRRGIDVRLQSSVNAVEPDRVLLAGGETLASHTVIWCAGIAPCPLLEKLDLPKDDLGYVLCDESLRVRDRIAVWAIGDCAVNPDPEGKAYPATAQHAVRQGSHLARNLSRVLRHQDPDPFVYDAKGSIVPLGCRTGVAKVFGLKLSGFPAWFLWRTVYLLKMPGFARKVRVALDWTIDLLFARDYVQLGVHRVPEKTTADQARAGRG